MALMAASMPLARSNLRTGGRCPCLLKQSITPDTSS